MIMIYTGDLERSCSILNTLSDTSTGRRHVLLGQHLYRILICSSVLKEQVANYNSLKVVLQEFDIKTVTDLKVLQKTTERLNVVHSIKLSISQIKHYFYQMMKSTENEHF